MKVSESTWIKLNQHRSGKPTWCLSTCSWHQSWLWLRLQWLIERNNSTSQQGAFADVPLVSNWIFSSQALYLVHPVTLLSCTLEWEETWWTWWLLQSAHPLGLPPHHLHCQASYRMVPKKTKQLSGGLVGVSGGSEVSTSWLLGDSGEGER